MDHFPGILSAVVISASGTFKEFAENSCKAVKWLFYSGLRCHLTFSVTSLEPSIVQDAAAVGEGTPSPMLSISGLILKQLQSHVSQTNQHLSAISQLHVLSQRLSSSLVRAQNRLDQSKTLFSQRKPVSSIRFLPVAVTYHREYLDGAAE